LGAFHDSVVETIAGWIVSSRFPAGAALPVEQAIGDELSASRTTVREALKTLAAKGLVRVGPRTGTRVLPADHWNLLDPQVVAWRLKAPVTRALIDDLVEMRLMIEPAAVELAALKSKPTDIASIHAALQAMRRAVDGDGSYIEADLAFHGGILRASDNQFLVQLAPIVGAVLRLSFELSVTSLESARASLPDHAAVLDAIEERDAGAARERLVGIILASRQDMESVLPLGGVTKSDRSPRLAAVGA
jgi:DNA-binding FadR family transcriptional regulator